MSMMKTCDAPRVIQFCVIQLWGEKCKQTKWKLMCNYFGLLYNFELSEKYIF